MEPNHADFDAKLIELTKGFPYQGSCPIEEFVSYVRKVLDTSAKMPPEYQTKMFTLILDKLLLLDLSAKKRCRKESESSGAIFEMDSMTSPDEDFTNLLDCCIVEVITFFESIPDKMKLFNTIYPSFMEVIFSSSKVSVVQYILLSIVSSSKEIVKCFLEKMNEIISMSDLETDLTQASSYATSLILAVDKSFTDEQDLVSIWSSLASWMHDQLDRITTTDSDDDGSLPSPNDSLRLSLLSESRHKTFCLLFQSLMCTLVSTGGHVSDESHRTLKILNLHKLVTSVVNPLASCPDSKLLSSFSFITSHLELAMCSSIIQRNFRNKSSGVRNRAFVGLDEQHGIDSSTTKTLSSSTITMNNTTTTTTATSNTTIGKEYTLWLPFHSSITTLSTSFPKSYEKILKLLKNSNLHNVPLTRVDGDVDEGVGTKISSSNMLSSPASIFSSSNVRVECADVSKMSGVSFASDGESERFHESLDFSF